MVHLKAILAVVVVAGILFLPLYFYHDFLNQGRSPTPSSLILNELQKNGLKNFSLPEFETSKEHQLSQFEGQVILLNFWATWCVPCVKEIPSMMNLVRKMKGKLVVLAVAQDRSQEELKAFLKSFRPIPEGFYVLWDQHKEVAKAYGTEVLPESYVISPKLSLVRKVVGVEEWDHEEALSFFTDIYDSSHANSGQN